VLDSARAEFLQIASRDDAEAFAVTWGLSRAFQNQAPGPQHLGVWAGEIDGRIVRMTLRWFDEIAVVAPNAWQLNKASLSVADEPVVEVTYRGKRTD
jgi:hypothetical protein